MTNDAMHQRSHYKTCGAHSRRSGKPCRNPPMIGRQRCRMHGGKCGAKPGNTNALKHGLRSKAEQQRIKAIRQLLTDCRSTLEGEPYAVD